MDEMENARDMDDLEGTGARLKVKCSHKLSPLHTHILITSFWDSLAAVVTDIVAWQGERDRLKDENEKLAADVNEDPMYCADTEDNDALVEQIKGLKGENDRFVCHV